ncbi:MAG: T9SS type A sorting domain-containing protein [Candidatus Marinimicrobia bacterium]|nr:T9SS type A sorting domain-containing protein [Candidatus Neomarinimicrobiota bacterium]
MKQYIIGFIILLFNLLTSQITVSLDNNNTREVPLFGLSHSSLRYNDFDDSGIEYDFGEPDFDSAALCINPHVLTFPGATPCYFDWTSGWVLPQESIRNYVDTLNTIGDGLYYAESLDDYSEAETPGAYFFEISNRDYEWWENADGSWNPINIGLGAFTNFIDTYGIEGTFVLNMLTSSIDTNMSMIRKGLEEWNDASDDAPPNIQVPFKYVELGNEFYLRGGGDKWEDEEPRNYKYNAGETLVKDKDEDGKFDPGRFEFIYPTPQSFAEECSKYIDSLSTILPNAKIAISSKNKPGDPRSDDWTRQVLLNINPQLIDLETIYLSWHEYLRFEEKTDDLGNQDTLNAEQVMAFPQFRHDDMLIDTGMDSTTITTLENDLGMKIRIWLTESAFREIGEKPWILKWAQSLVNIQNYSLMLRNPYLEIIMLNALHGWYSTSAINHGHQFPDEFPPYDDQASCSPYGRTATAFSIYFWNYISKEMTHMQELIFENTNGDHLGVISENPFEGEDVDSNQSPDVGYEYSYLLGWKFFNANESIQRALITNVADESKTLQFNDGSGFTTNIRCIAITSQNESNLPAIDQYINGDGDLTYDTTLVDFSTSSDQEIVIPAYSVVLFEEVESPLKAFSTPTIPGDYKLHLAYPNPFNPITSLRYDLPEQAQVTLTVYDLMGREVAQLVNTTQEAGYKSIQWDATDSFGKPVSAGVYLYQVRAGEFVQTRKMALLK